jgi:hypothetical protein
MIYVTPFFQRFYPNYNHVNYSELDNISQAKHVAVDFYTNDFNHHSKIIDKLLQSNDQLYVYLSEPTDSASFINLLNKFDLPNVHFYSDCVLNFTLSQATFTPTINWFIDPVNYYTQYSWAKQLLTKLDFSANKPYRFDILLGQEKTHRNKLNSLVLSSQYKDLFIYSYYKKNISNGILWDSNINTFAHQLTSELFNIDGEDARPSAILPVEIYNQSYYSVICETTDYNSYNQYTEKVAKPILAKRPFIVFAGQYYLKNLKSLGFKTFDSILDESYDNEPNETLRFILAWQQVEWMCQQQPSYILSQLLPILEHNQQHFLNTDWASSIKNLF